ncbi:MAG: PIN domain-containing protein [Oscillatoria sp. SIO1A7]|nr:PIN domain-containing protein [Oscillatoria sp. SIO1A7]
MLKPLWLRFEAGTLEIVSSELTLMETLVAPLKNADDLLEDAYENLLAQIRLIPIALPTLREAARLRAETNLKTPDALHAATALLASFQMFVTNDYDYKRIPGLPAVILREVMES